MSDQKKIIEAIAENLALQVADIDLEANLKDDLGLNPVEISDLLDDLSQKFNILFDPAETIQVQTARDLVDMVEDKLLE
ncbi:MAG: acyl carrier protein [Candidatus Daviesbacteria bacterium]